MCGNLGFRSNLSRAIRGFQYLASTRLRYQSFDNCLEDKPIKFCQSLVKTRVETVKFTTLLIQFSILRIKNHLISLAIYKCYKLALCLYKLYNNNDFNPVEFVSLNFNQEITTHQTTFRIIKNNRTKVGLDSLTNRFYSINNTIPLEWCTCRLSHLN